MSGPQSAAAHPQPAFVPRTAAIETTGAPAATPADELRAGLAWPQATVSPKFLYDRLGSALFTAITELPEYYPTRTEAGIFSAHAAEMAAFVRPALPEDYALVDLGTRRRLFVKVGHHLRPVRGVYAPGRTRTLAVSSRSKVSNRMPALIPM